MVLKQLILKDFIIQWKFLIWYILYPVFFYMALTDTENLFIIMSVIITIGATVKTFEADSKNESEVIVNSLPILKTNCVCEIYSSNYYSFYKRNGRLFYDGNEEWG